MLFKGTNSLDGIPVMIVVLIFQNGKPPGRELGLIKYKGTVLKMKNIIPSDSGNYTCFASNKFETINKTFTVKVVGKFSCVFKSISKAVLS